MFLCNNNINLPNFGNGIFIVVAMFCFSVAKIAIFCDNTNKTMPFFVQVKNAISPEAAKK
jgi:hypothetical protein